MTGREKRIWLAATALCLVAVIGVCLLALLAGNSAEASPPVQSSQTRALDYVYWTNYGTGSNGKVQRQRADGSGLIATIASGSTDAYQPQDLFIDGDFAYWTNYGTGSNGKVQRQRTDGTGPVTTIATGSTDAYLPRDLVIDGAYVYWTNYTTGSQSRVQRALKDGTGSVETVASGSTSVYNARDLVIDGAYVYWTNHTTSSSRSKVQRKRKDGSGSITTIAAGSTDAYNPRDLVISGDFAYWTNYHTSIGKVQRKRKDGSGAVTTIASGSTDAYQPRDLVIDGDHAYWTNYHSSSGKVQRKRADGTGAVTTIASGSTDARNPRDLVIHGDHAHWTNYHTGSNGKIQRALKDGTGAVQTIASGSTDAYQPRDLVIRSETESVSGACVTDAGTLAADYGSHPWDAAIDGMCPNAFYTFRLPGDADLRLSAAASDVDPIPVLRRGGIGGEVVALTTAANGVATRYIHRAEAGEYTIEMARGPGSAQATGSFMAVLETQPALDGCEVNLGTLSSEQLQVYGKYDPSCGDTRKYYVYLEFQASVGVSASAVGFTPRIELRPGGASDSAAAAATDSGNPADVYQQVTSGSYRINLEAIAADATYNLTFQAFGLPPPTRTPIPTPTPRFQPNVDVRMDPDPRSVRYEKHRVYRFRLEGGEGSFPAIVRTGNRTAFRLTTDPHSSLDCRASGQLDHVALLQAVHLHVCADAVSSAIEVIKASDYSLLAQYPLYVAGPTPATPGAVPVTGGYVAPPEDRIGLGILISALCDGANVTCQVELIRNALGAAVSTVLFVVPTQVARGRPSRYAYGIGIAAFIVGLLLANFLVGTPMWWGAVCVIGVIALFLAGAYLKLRRLGA